MKVLNWQGTLFFFMVSPLLCLPLIVYNIYLEKKYAFTFLALFLGLVALLYAPTHDLFRHNLFYFDSRYNTNLGFVFRQDLTLFTLSLWFAKWGINFEIIRFLFVFISYQLYFSIFNSLINSNANLRKNRRMKWWLFVLLFLSIRFFVICCGLRQGLATSLALFGVYKLLVENKRFAYLYLILAPLTHLSLIVVSLGAILIKFKIIRLNLKLCFFLIIIFYVLSASFMEKFSGILGGDLGQTVETYTTGYWGAGGEAQEQISFKGLIASLLNQIQLIPLIYFIYKTKDYTKYFSFVLFSLILCAATFSFFSIIDRMIMISLGASLFYFFQNYNGSKLHLKIAKIELMLVAIFFSVSLYAERPAILLSREYKLIMPVPYILMNTYSEEWLWNNVKNWEK